jgi:hypothetical protein
VIDFPSPAKINIDVKADITHATDTAANIVDRTSKFLGKIFGPSAPHVGGMISDQFQAWRASNLDRLQRKWERRRQKSGVAPDAIKLLPFNLGVRLISEACIEDSDDVLELWANLLEVATDPKAKFDVGRVHVDILRSITTVEAFVLKFLWLRHQDDDLSSNTLDQGRALAFYKSTLKKIAVEQRSLAIQNLMRQQCVRFIPDEFTIEKIDSLRDSIIASDEHIDIGGVKEALEAARQVIEKLSGVHDGQYFRLTNNKKGKSDWMPEIPFMLTVLGRDLMNVCTGIDSDGE